MKKKHLIFLFVAISAFNADASQNNSIFCNSIRDLPLNNIQKIKKAVHEINTIRTSDYSRDNGRSVEDIEKTISPYKFSADLKKEFQNKIGDDDQDYDVYRTPDASIFNFHTTEGSLQCPVDIWALNKGGTLETLDFQPDLGDACNVVRVYGLYKKEPILIQYSFVPLEKDGVNLTSEKIDEIHVVNIKINNDEDACVIKLN